MNGLGTILLHMLRRMNGERTVSGCYYILKGKKSGQAIQDSALFRYKSWFGSFPHLETRVYQAEVQSLLSQRLIKKKSSDSFDIDGKDFYLVTQEGIQFLEREAKHFRIDDRGFLLEEHHVTLAEVYNFWKTFQLLAQVLSFSLHRIRYYSPIIHDVDIQDKFKRFWVNIRDKQAFATQLRQELDTCLAGFDDKLFPELITSRLSGYRVTGLTFRQLEQVYDIPEAFLQLYLYQGVGYLLYQIKKQQSSCLYGLSLLSESYYSLTASAKKTFDMLKQGFSLDEIAKQRDLKKSTIEDHIIEITIHDESFDLTPFVSTELLLRIRQASQTLQTKKLSLIKKELQHEASYFQIRLALLKE